MHTYRCLCLATAVALLSAVLALAPRARGAEDAADIVAVYSSASPDYVRTPLPAGGFRPETFAFGEGGLMGGTMRDLSIDQLRLPGLARLIAPALAAQDYLPASDPKKTDLLIVVYWGLTPSSREEPGSPLSQGTGLAGIPPPHPPVPAGNHDPNGSGGDPSMTGQNLQAAESVSSHVANDAALDAGLSQLDFANTQRDQQDQRTALLLGYLPALKDAAGPRGTALEQRRRDLVEELEDGRYFVVLMAYDFRLLAGQRKRKLLWETRFSIRERGHDFSKDVAAMAAHASRYFGRDSDGLRRDTYDARVEIGTPRVIESGDDKK
jgi:hypothetical protein